MDREGCSRRERVGFRSDRAGSVVSHRVQIRKRIDPEVAQRYLATIRRIADVAADPVEVEATTRDVDDDHLVALACEHGADYIVTGDRDLLEWPEQRPPVLTPAAFAGLLAE